jgi:hypothetical protein
LNLGPNELLKLVLPLYGLTEGGGYWGEALTKHHTDDLKMKHTKGDFSLFFKHVANRLVGLSGSFVDDLVRAGTLNFKTHSSAETQSRFDIKHPTETTSISPELKYTAAKGTNACHKKTTLIG